MTHRCDTVAHMTTITYRRFVTDARIRKQVKAGKPFLVSQDGQPYFRVLPPEKAVSSEGAAKHLYQGRGVSPLPVPKDEWKGLE